jgi:hypothetical protein
MVDSVFCATTDVVLNAPITPGFTGFNNQITPLIASTSTNIKNFCRRKFDLGTYVEYTMSPDGQHRFRIKEAPITAGSFVLEYDPTGVFVNPNYVPTTLVENIDYIVDYDQGFITVVTRLRHHMRGLRSTYIGGYAVTNGILQVPATLVTATSIQVAFTLGRIKASAMGEEQQAKARSSLEKFSVSATTGLISEVQAMLTPYRAPMVGRH